MLSMNIVSHSDPKAALAWSKIPIGIDAWKANCLASSHVREGDTLHFNTDAYNVVSAWIDGTSVCLGYFFIDGDERSKIVSGAGWNHL
jgi:hypothetical protein